MKDFSFATNFSSMLIECLGLLLFFRRLEKRNEGALRFFTGLFLLPLLIIYLPIIEEINSTNVYSLENLINQLLRTAINLAGVFTYVCFSKEKKPVTAAYLSAVYVLSYMVAFNIRENIKPYLMSLFPAYFELSMVLSLAVILFAVVFTAERLIELDEIKQISFSRWTVVSIALIIELYFKWSLVAPDSQSQQRLADTFFYSLCATVGVFALVVLFEMNESAQKKRSFLELEKMQMQYEMQNAKRTLQANSDIKRIYHDMKNHVLALQSMDGSDEIKEYLSELSVEFEGYENNVNTGSSIADSLISEKIQLARLHDISFNVCVDLKPLDFVHSIDMVTIIGNALDNAIEAVSELDEEERIIYIKSIQYANMLLLRFSNRFVGKLVQDNGILRTSKADTEMHGIGLSSIKKAAKRYGGSVETQFENEDGWFRLVVMLPLPDT